MSTTITRVDFSEYMERALHGKPEVDSPALWHGRKSRGLGAERAEFTGTRSFDEAARLASEGWAEGREMVGEILATIESRTQELAKPECVWDVSGDFVDVGAYVSGVPECMVRWEAMEAPKRVVRICANIAASCSVSCKAMRWKGACVLALVDKLESSGIRVELDIAAGFDGGTPKWIVVANVKRADEPLHLDRLAFHLVHPSSFRRVMWSFEETCAASLVAAHGMHGAGNYGIPMRDLGPELSAAGEVYDLIVPGLRLTELAQAVREVEAMFGKVVDVELTR